MAESILLYGSTGSFKTAQVGFVARRIYERTGKVTRLVCTDGGGWKPLEPLVQAGVIEAWNVSMLANPLAALRKLSKGFWPVVSKDGKTMAFQSPTPQTWEHVGAYAVDGITSIGDMLFRNIADNQTQVSGEELLAPFTEEVNVLSADGTKMTVEKEKFSATTRGHYGFVQNQQYGLMMNFRSLPLTLDRGRPGYAIYTALEARGEEEETRTTIIGPALAGKKKTAVVGAWVGDLIHMDDYTVEVADPTHRLVEGQKGGRTILVTQVRAYFVKHPDPLTRLQFPAKPRVASEKVKALLERFPGGYFEPTLTGGLDTYLDAVESLQNAAYDDVVTWKAAADEARNDVGQSQKSTASAQDVAAKGGK